MPETPEQIKERIRWEQKQQMYAILVFIVWLGIVALLQTFVPIAALFIAQTWWIFGTTGMLLMIYFIFKQGATKFDVVAIPMMILVGPVGIMFLLTWMILIRIQRKRINRHGKTVQSA